MVRYIMRDSIILHRINPNLGAAIDAGWNGEIKSVETLLPFPEVACRARSQSGWNFRHQPIMIGSCLLECVDESFSTWHVDAFACRVVVKVIRDVHARHRDNHAARN